MRWVFALSAAVWILIGAVVVGLRGPEAPAPQAASAAVGSPSYAALARCRRLGEAAKHDTACRAAWALARAHFFDGGRS
jgi:conjugative transfer region protein TrbK